MFLSPFLLFQVQLIISKYMLPWFGGSAAVLMSFWRISSTWKLAAACKGVVGVERDHVQDQVLRNPLGRTDDRLAAAGALEPMQPNHGDAGLGLHNGHDLGHHKSL
jgi:hypothetical protein